MLAAFTAQGQVAMKVAGGPSAFTNGVRIYNFNVENLAPSSSSEYFMIGFSIHGFSSTNDIFGITVGSDFSGWTHSFSQTSNGLYTLVVSVGAGEPFVSDGISNSSPLGNITFYTPCAAMQTNHATAWAYGEGPGRNIPFTPVGVVLPGPMPGVPGLSVGWAGGNDLSVTATNLAPGYGYTVERSPDLLAWTHAATFWATNATQPLPLPPSTNLPAQFYRLSCP